MVFQNWIADIKEKTIRMDRKDAMSYVITYYWYHMLIIASIIALILLFVWHYLFGNKKALFTCVLVNQEVTDDNADALEGAFAVSAGLDSDRTVINPNYFFSYGDVQIDGVNETSYEKFFLQWQNGEIDVVIFPESLYLYCREMGGEFYVMEEAVLGSYEAYIDEDTGTCTAVVLGTDSLTETLTGENDEKLLLAFPSTGKHEETAIQFLEYLSNVKEEDAGSLWF